MGNPLKDLANQTTNKAKEQAGKMIKQALKNVGKKIVMFIAPAIPYILIFAVLVIILVGIFGIDDADAETETTTSELQGGTPEEIVWFALLKANYSKIAIAGVMGNIYGESSFNPNDEYNGAYGLCQWRGGRRNSLQAFAASRGSSESDIYIQVEFLVAEISGEGADGYASNNFLKSSSKYDGHRYVYEEWSNAKDIAIATKAFCCCWERPGKSEYDGSIQKRIQAANKYYEQFKDRTMDEFNNKIISNNSLLNAIDKVAKYLEENNYTYKNTGSANYTFPIYSSQKRTLSCSSFVQQCLLEAGYTQFSGGEKIYARRDPNLAINDLAKGGITNVKLLPNLNSLKPGDILHCGGGDYHVVFVYAVNGNNIVTKGVPEVLNSNHGFNGKTRTIKNLQQFGYFAIRIMQ